MGAVRPPGVTALPDDAQVVERVVRESYRVLPSPRCPNAARKKQQYECAAKEFELTREAMRALNIEADFKGLPLFDKWSRYTERRQDHVITDNRKHNKNRIARAKAAAEAAAASEAGSSQAGPSVRDRSNTRSPLAMLTTRCLAQRAGTLAGLARWWGVARATASSLMAAVMQVLPSSSPAHILAKFGAPPDPTKPREVFRTEFNRKASSCARVCVGGCSSRVAHRAPCVWD